MYQAALSPISNRETWTETFNVVDDDGAGVDLTDAEILVEVRNKNKSSVLTAEVASGITLDEASTGFSWTFTATQMRALCAGTYDIGCVVTIDDTTTQLFVGSIQVVDGVVS